MRWWKRFLGRGGGRTEQSRRRQAERFNFAVALKARCSSWPKFAELMSGDVSAGGLFIPTEQLAELGESIELELTLPDGNNLPLSATVVNVFGAEAAARLGKRPGLGVKLEPPTGPAKALFESLLSAARQSQPQPENQFADGRPVPPPIPKAASATTTTLQVSDVLEAAAKVAEVDADDFEVDFEEEAASDAAHHANTAAAAAKSIPLSPIKLGPIIGIDFGTTNTSISVIENNRVKIVPGPEGENSFPSVVCLPPDGSTIVGRAARERLGRDPRDTIAAPKRLLGRKYDDRTIQGLIGQAAYRTSADPNGEVIVELGGREYSIVQVCSYILAEARDRAEKSLGTRIESCVVSVPVSFDEHRIELLRRAGKLAHLDVVAVIDEPSSAALANRFDGGFGGTVGVYDFGGGTFDFSIVDVSRGDFMVLATAGDSWLGGGDFDQVLAEAAANQFWRKHEVELRNQAVEWQRLLLACERAKKRLSTEASAVIHVPDVLRTATGMVDLKLGIDRAILDQVCEPVIRRSLDTCEQALSLLDMKPNELTAVYLSGGTTYIPAVRAALASYFGVPVRTGVPPEFSVCLGTAIHAAQLATGAGTTLDNLG